MFTGSFHLGLPLTDNHFEQMSRIYCEGFSEAPWFESWELSNVEDYLRKSLLSSTYILALDEKSDVLGFAIGMALSSYSDNKALLSLEALSEDFYISDIVVDKLARGRRIALSMMQILYNSIKTSGFLFRTHIDNKPMHVVAKNLGLTEIGRIKSVTGGKESQRVVFRCSR